MPVQLRLLLSAAALVLLTACGLTKDKELASKSVDTFHQQFNDEKFAEIYAGAAPGFRTSSAEPDYLKFMQAVRRKLGAYKSGTAIGWRINATPGGTFVSLAYKSDFERGSANESFIFVLSGGKTALQSYNVNSPALVIN